MGQNIVICQVPPLLFRSLGRFRRSMFGDIGSLSETLACRFRLAYNGGIVAKRVKRLLVARRIDARKVGNKAVFHAVSAGPEAVASLCGLIPVAGPWSPPRRLSAVSCLACKRMMTWASQQT